MHIVAPRPMIGASSVSLFPYRGGAGPMGLFKDLKRTTQAVAAAPQAKAAAEAEAAALRATDIDPDDPVLEPVEGVTIERYAELCAALAGAGLASEADVDTWAVAQGLEPGSYQRVSEAWNTRMGTHRALTNRFGALYSAAAR